MEHFQGGIPLSWLDLRARVPQERFAELIGVTQPTVSGLIAGGVLERDGRVGDWLRAYCRHVREAAAGRDETSPLANERRRLTAAKAALAELEVRRRAGELVEVVAIEREYGRALRAARDAVFAVPPRVSPVVAAETDASAVDQLLHRELAHALEAAVTAICGVAAEPKEAADG